MKVKAYHRTNEALESFRPGSFFCEQPLSESLMYGDRLYTVELTVNNPAKDEDVLAAAVDLGLESETVDNPYEYLSPGLFDACVTREDVNEIILLLTERGFDCAHVKDCDCPRSWVIFRAEQVNVLEVA